MHYSVVFFGSSHHSLPALEKLAADPLYSIVGVVSQKDKPVGRKQILTPTPVSVWAREHGVTLLTPDSWKKDVNALERLRSLGANVGVLAIYGKILPQAVLDVFPHGIINIHPSILPKYRGPAPAVGVLLHGECESGVTIIKLVAEMDAGPVLGIKAFPVADDEVPETYYEKGFRIGADMLMDVLPRYLSGDLHTTEQDHTQATFTHMLSRDDGKIDWTKSAVEIERQVRAMTPWPGTWTEVWVGSDGKVLLEKEMSERLGLTWHGDNWDGMTRKRMKVLRVALENENLRLDMVQIEGEKIQSFNELI